MTTTIRVGYRSGNKVVKVYRETLVNGTWERRDDISLNSRGDESEPTVWDTQRVVIEEFGPFKNTG